MYLLHFIKEGNPTIAEMSNKQSQYAGDYFPKQIASRYHQDQIDPKRIKRVQMLIENYQDKQQKKQQQQFKAPVKFHKFRQDARKLHRQLAQQNHDYLKMTQTITKSVLDNNRFELSATGKGNKNKVANLLDMNNRDSREVPNLNLDYNIQLNSALTENKINTKQVLQLYPYKKMSIEMEPNNLIKPQFQFFFFSTDTTKFEKLHSSLVEIVEEGLPSDVKQQIAFLTHYMDYFDYIEFCKNIFMKPKIPGSENRYPPQVLELARNSLIVDGSSEEEEDYNKRELIIDTYNSYHRIFECDQSQLSKPFDSIYFQDLKDFENYKKLRIIQYKNLKIEDQDIVINTDVRNIISSQKIYLINIIEQMHLSVQLLKTSKQRYLMKPLHQTMLKKIYEYLHLVCGYTKSTILIRYNIADPYSKIYEFLYKSIMYGKPYERVERGVIEKYPVLEIWYHLPEKIYGYAREEIHRALYRLIEATIEFEKNMQYIEQYQGLKIKQYARTYLPDSK